MTEVEWRGPDSPLVSDRGTTIPRNPYRKLRQWARSNGRGFYSTSILRRHAGEVYREYLAYAVSKRREHEAASGVPD